MPTLGNDVTAAVTATQRGSRCLVSDESSVGCFYRESNETFGRIADRERASTPPIDICVCEPICHVIHYGTNLQKAR